jgi:hypothetical protein
VVKRATLPKADDVLIGRAVEPRETNPPKVVKHKKSTVLKRKSTIEKKSEPLQVNPNAPKTQTSIHLTVPTITRIEEVKYRLLAEYGVKAKKSTIVEVALKEGLSDLEQLAQALRPS